MTNAGGDNSEASVPEPKKLKIAGRNVEVRKLILKDKIRVSRFFALILAAMKGEGYIQLEGGIRVPRKLDLKSIGIGEVLDNLPKTLEVLENNFEGFLGLTTDLDPEKEIPFVELEDLFAVAEETWSFNGFGKSMEKAVGKALEVVEAAGLDLNASQLSKTSSPSSPSTSGGEKNKS